MKKATQSSAPKLRSGHAVAAALSCAMVFFVAVAMAAFSSAALADNAFITGATRAQPPSGASQLCQRYSWACSDRSSQSIDGRRELSVVKQINRHVNASTREISDQSQYRLQEKWALPTKLGGDCEDFVLLKKRNLIEAGVDPKRLLIATVLDTRRRGHAVLVYRSPRGDMVLDNVTNQIKAWSATRYLFLRMQDPNQPRRWLGVYRKS